MGRTARLLATLAIACLAAVPVRAADPPRRTIVIGSDLVAHPLVHYVAANTKTYFKARRYDIRFRTMDADELLRAFAAGEIQVMTASPASLPAIETTRGRDVRLFVPLARWTPGPMLLVKADSEARTVADLKGKVIAIPPRATRAGHEEAAVLARTGTPIARYFSLRTRADAADALVAGKVAGAFVEDRARELLATGRYRVVLSVQQAYREALGDPAVMRSGLVAEREFVNANRDVVADLVAAIGDAWQRYQANPEPVVRSGASWGRVPASLLARTGEALQLGKLTTSDRAVTARDVRTWTRLYPLLSRAAGALAPQPAHVPELFIIGAPVTTKTP